MLTAYQDITSSEVQALIDGIVSNVSAAGVEFTGVTSAYDNASAATSALATLQAGFPSMKSHVVGATVVSVSGSGVTPAYLSSMVSSIYSQGGGGRVDTVTLTTNDPAYTSELVAEANAGKLQGFQSAKDVENGNPSDGSDGAPVGAIVGGVIAGVVVIALAAVGSVWMYKKLSSSNADLHMENSNEVLMVDTISFQEGDL